MKVLTATIKTKSNFRNLNGQTLEVIEIVGTRVTCKSKLIQGEFAKTLTIDFTLQEVTLHY